MPLTNRQKDCPFCDASRDLAFAESSRFAAIYNIAPILPGHSLVVPKRHVVSLLDLDDSELAEFAVFGRTVVRILMDAFCVHSFNWTIQEGESAGQSVSHLHMHVIPRKAGDLPSPNDWYPMLKTKAAKLIESKSRAKLTKFEMARVVAHLRTVARRYNVTAPLERAGRPERSEE